MNNVRDPLKTKTALSMSLIMLLVFFGPAFAGSAVNPQQPVFSSKKLPGRGGERVGENRQQQDRYVADELLVKFKSGVGDDVKEKVHAQMGAAKIRKFPGLRIHKVKLKKGTLVEDAIKNYGKDPNVEYAEPNYLVHSQRIPDDARFNELWGLTNTGQTGGTPGADIHAPDGWNITTGDSEVVVAVLDTGIDYTHPDLVANVWTNPREIPGNLVDEDGNGYSDDMHGVDAFNGDSDPFDDNGHGTHVAGIIGAVGNNGAGVVGVNWNVRIVSCKFLGSDGAGTTADAIECLEYVRNLKNSGVNIVATNNSWSGGEYSQALYEAINAQRDILFIAAAGNNSADNDVTAVYPANYALPNIIAVAATDNKDSKAFFSDHGRHSVHVSAPGVKILSTLPAQNEWNIAGGYGLLSGTSMATPYATGLAALIKAQDPARGWTAIRNLLLSGGDTISSVYERTITGKRVNAAGSLACSDSPLFSVLQQPSALSIGTPVTLSAVSVNCAAPRGPVTVSLSGGEVITLADDGIAPDLAAGDGIFTATWTPVRPREVLQFSSPAGQETIEFPSLGIATGYLANGPLNASYAQTLSSSDGYPPYSWSLVSGALPPGLALDPSTGVISGIPTGQGMYFFALQVTDAYGARSIKDTSISIYPPGISESWNRTFYPGAYIFTFDYGSGKTTDTAVDSHGNVYVTRLGYTSTYAYYLVKFDPSGTELWSRNYDGTGYPWGITLDKDDNVYLTGESSGTFLTMKLDPAGNTLWTRTYDDGSGDHAGDIAADDNGNVYVAGFSNSAGFVAVKYDPAGNVIWTKTTKMTEGNIVMGDLFGIAVDEAGNVYVTGYILDWSSGRKNSQIIIIKYDAFGNDVWTRTFDNGGNEKAEDIAADPAGNIYVVGSGIGSSPYAVLLKYDPDGNLLWSRTEDPGTHGIGLLLDRTGDVYVAGSIQGTSYSSLDYLVVKYDSAGCREWAFALDRGGTERGERLAMDPDGNILITGSAAGWSGGHTVKLNVLAISPSSLPLGTTGSAYTATLSARGGAAPYSWAIVSGGLPAGLTLESSSGVISGTPAAVGTWTFAVQVTDANGLTASKQLTITIYDLVITAPPVAYGTVDREYSSTLTASGGLLPYSWSIASGSLPVGLALNSATGVISGTPHTAGTASFTAMVTDGNSRAVTKQLSIAVVEPLFIATASLPNGVVGARYSQTVTAAGGVPPCTWSLVSGSLPASLALDSATGTISGTPSQQGTSTFTIQATDSNASRASKTLSITVYTPPTITTTSLNSGSAFSQYSQTLQATGGASPYTWSVSSGSLPPGLSLVGSSGVISGTPTTPGTFVFTAMVTGSNLASSSKQFSIWITNPLSISNTSLPDAALRVPYSVPLMVYYGGVAPFTWAITSGSLPDGLTLDSASGEIWGTPLAAGTFAFTIQVTDSRLLAATRSVSITARSKPNVSVQWAKLLNTGTRQTNNDVAFDADGNVIVTGTTNYSQGWLTAKYDPSGNLLWTRTYDNGGKDDAARSVAVDSTGAIYVSGTAFNGSNSDFLTLKYDPSGNLMNIWPYDQGNSEQAYAITVDGNDNFYVAGRDGNLAWLTIKYAPSGDIVWKRTFNAPSVSSIEDMAVDTSGNVFVTGYRESGSVHSWVTIKYDAAGNLSWSRVYSPGSDDLAHGVTVDNDGGAYVAGSCNYSTAGKWFIVKYDASGNIVWSRTSGSAWFDQSYSIASDSSGNIYACGYDSSAGRGITIIKYDPSGAQLWKDAFQIDTECMSIAVDRGGNILVASIANVNMQDNFLTAKYWQNLPLKVTTSSLASGATGTHYSQTLSASGGVMPYAWALASGSLPAGLSLGSSTGLISGTPLSAGTYSFTAQVTDTVSQTATRPFSMTIDSVSFIVTATTGSHGTISPSGPVPVPEGQNMSFFITSDPGYDVASVSGCAGTLAGSTYTTGPITADCTVSAIFVPITWTLSISVTGTGTVHTSPGTDLACTSNCGMSYDEGTVVTLSATSGTGQMFAGWSGACSGTGTCQVTMNAAKSVTATFSTIAPATGATLTAAPASPRIVGTPVTFTAGGIGGSGTYEYKFRLLQGTSWVVKRGYSSENTWTWDTKSLSPGTYTVQVHVRSAGSSAVYEAAKLMTYTLVVSPASGATLTAAPASPRAVGTPVTFTAGGIGGSGTYEYKFRLLQGTSWVVKRGYSTEKTWTWDTTGLTPGTYTVQVHVRCAGSSAVYEAAKIITYVLQ